MRVLVLALALAISTGAVAQQTPPLPEERKGDPVIDTQQAAEFLKRGRYEDAIRQAKLALGRDERYVPAMVVLAKAYYHNRKYELSTAIIDIAKSIDANNPELYNLLGFLSLTKEDHISATAAFKKATELKDDYAAAWNNLTAQYLHAKNYDGALQSAEKAVQLAPNFAKAHLNLGSALRGMQRYEEAERAYRRAIQLDPTYADAYFNLGILYLDAKEMPGHDLVSKMNTAIAHLNRYKQLTGARLTRDDPADTYIAEARTGIDRETKRLERLRRQQERDRTKAAPAPAPAQTPAPAQAPAPAAAPTPSGKTEEK